jgi:ATPase family associated with various cellular activities (AAA)
MSRIDTTTLRRVPVATPLPDYIAAGTPAPPGFLVSRRLRRTVLAWARRHRMARRGLIGRPPTLFVCQGPPGTGKTTQIRVALTEAGVNVVSFAASDLTNPDEGANVRALQKRYDECAQIERVTGRLTALDIDDGDIILSTPPDMQLTINRAAAEAWLQTAADPGATGAPIVITGNCFRHARPSLLRPQRAVIFTHEPTVEEVAQAACALLGITTEADGVLLGKVLALLPEKPIAFWSEVARQLAEDRLHGLIEAHGDDDEAIAAALAKPEPLTAETLEQAVETALAARSADFLNPTTETKE